MDHRGTLKRGIAGIGSGPRTVWRAISAVALVVAFFVPAATRAAPPPSHDHHSHQRPHARY